MTHERSNERRLKILLLVVTVLASCDAEALIPSSSAAIPAASPLEREYCLMAETEPRVVYRVNSITDWQEVAAWTMWLEQLSLRSGEKSFKAYLVYSNVPGLNREQMEQRLSALERTLNVTKVALTYMPSPQDEALKTRNTFVVYVNRRVVDTFVNFSFD
jgi:hypothetical protein